MPLWDFQERALEEIHSHLVKPYQPGVYVAPTGSGKSETFGHAARSSVALGKRVGVAVNRRILVRDLCKRVAAQGLEYGVVMGSERPKPWAPVQVMSLDTLWRREHLPKLDILWLDEAHFSLAEKYLTVVERYVAAGTPVIGMTATPVRGLGDGLGPTYKWMVRAPDTPELIQHGYLVPPRVFSPGKPNMKGVEIVGGDYNQRQLEEACNQEVLIGDILKYYQSHLRGKPAISFCVSIKHCNHINEIFLAAGIKSIVIDHTYKGDLDLVWRRLASGEIEIVHSVMMIGYGWNVPEVEGMISARPCAGLGLWLQQCGRVLRTCERTGKTRATILDHAGNYRRHGSPDWPRDWSLDSKGRRPLKDDEPNISVSTCQVCFFTFKSGPRDCPDCGAPMPDKSRLIKTVDGELVEVTGNLMPGLPPPRPTPKRYYTESEKLKLFTELRARQQGEGYADTWLRIAFNASVGHFPPAEWMRGEAGRAPTPRQMKEILNQMDRGEI